MRRQEEASRRRARYLSENTNGKLIINLRDISHTMRALSEGKGSQKRVLMLLRKVGTITQRELTARLGIQSGSASEVITKLENTGLITRTLSEADRRTADLSLTEEGERQADAATAQRQRRHEEMFSVLSEAEKVQLLSLLEKINADWETRYQGCREQYCRTCAHPCGRQKSGPDLASAARPE